MLLKLCVPYKEILRQAARDGQSSPFIPPPDSELSAWWGGMGKSILNAYLPGSAPAVSPTITGASSGHLSSPRMLPQLDGEDSIYGHFQRWEWIPLGGMTLPFSHGLPGAGGCSTPRRDPTERAWALQL